MRRVSRGFSGVKTPLFEGMLAVRQPAEEGVTEAQVQVDDAVAAAVKENVAEDRVENLETDNAAQKLEIVKLKARVKKLEKANQIKYSKLRRLRKVGASKRVESSDDMEDVFNQERMIADMYMNEGIELVQDAKVAESEGRHAKKQAEIYNLDLDHSSKVLSMQEDDSEVQEVVEVVTTAKLIIEVFTAAASQEVSAASTTIPAASATIPAASTTIPAASVTIPAAKPTILAAVPIVSAAYTRRRKGKSDASEGFAQIIDFLSGSYIHYALTVSHPIYISCIKQFWNTAVVKRSGDVTRTSWNEFSTAMVSAVIYLSKGQSFNFSRYIFDSLVRNVDSSSKFYMYPRFIQLIIQAQVVDLSSHTTRYISPALTQKVFPNMRRVGKGCSGVETPLFENMLQVREEDAEEEVQVSAHDDVDQDNVIEEIVDDVAQPTSPLPPSPQVLDKCSALGLRVEGLESANTAQQLEIIKLKARVKKLERLNKVKSSKLRRLKKVGTSQRIESSEDEENVFNQGRISVDIDEGIELVDDQEKDDQEKDAQVATTAASIHIPAAEPVVVAVSTPISAVKPKVLKIVPAASTVSTRKRKRVVIRDPEEELHDDTPAETQSAKDKGK
nr:hypothetical protein [Tanacetum cinerariifolium]